MSKRVANPAVVEEFNGSGLILLAQYEMPDQTINASGITYIGSNLSARAKEICVVLTDSAQPLFCQPFISSQNKWAVAIQNLSGNQQTYVKVRFSVFATKG